MLLRILNGSLLELNDLARQAQASPLTESEASRRFMTQAVLASDAPLYPAPVAFELTGFEQVQASVPGGASPRQCIHLGCLLLILGVFAMLYVRERRLWVWLAPRGAGAQASMALSSNRKLLDVDREFEQWQRRLLRRESEL